jgi:hypothetical protein
MTDETFLTRFEAASLPSFDHRDHLRVVFAYARRGGVEHAIARAREGLRRFTAAHGQAARYHDTLTTAWARVVGHDTSLARDDDFDAFLAAHPRLLERDLLAAQQPRAAVQHGRAGELRRARPAGAALTLSAPTRPSAAKRVTDGVRIVVPGKDAGVGAVRTHCPTPRTPPGAARRPPAVTRRPWRGE